MKNFNSKLNNSKDKVVGEIKEKVGKITCNETMELDGKIQSTVSDIKTKIYKNDIGKNLDEIKEDIAGKINDIIDKIDKPDKTDK